MIPLDDRNLLKEVLRLFADSVVIPAQDQVLNDAHDVSRGRDAAWHMLKLSEHEADEPVTSEEAEQFRMAYGALALSTVQTESLVTAMVEDADNSPKLIRSLVALCAEFLEAGRFSDRRVVALVVLIEVLDRNSVEAASLREVLSRFVNEHISILSWYALICAVTVRALDADVALPFLPWHGLVVREPVVVSMEFDLMSRAWFTGDLVSIPLSAGGLAGLDALGRSIAAWSLHPGPKPYLNVRTVEDDLTVIPPQFGTTGIDWEDWSDHAVVGFVALLKLLTIAKGKGWISNLDEVADGSPLARVFECLVGFDSSRYVQPEWRQEVQPLVFLIATGRISLVNETI